MGDGTLLIVFTVVEVVLLVAVLLGAFLLLARELRAISEGMAQAAGAVGDLEAELADVRPGVHELNEALDDLAARLPALSKRAEDVAARRHGP